jgi:hypothetical protein
MKKKKKSLLTGNLIYSLPIEDFCKVTKEMQLKTTAPEKLERLLRKVSFLQPMGTW